MRFRDLIEHNVQTRHPGFNKTKLRTVTNDEDEDDADSAPVVDFGVFGSPSLDPAADMSDATTPGATAAGLASTPTRPGFE